MRLRAMTSGAVIVTAMAAVSALLLGATTGGSGERTLFGTAIKIGAGTARMFVDLARDGTPRALGVALSEAAMRDLPTRMNHTSRCFDKDGDKQMSHGECIGDYETTLALPNEATGLNLPVRYATVNWNPEGHAHPAPQVWSAPHFDFHFFLVEPSVINSIRPGSCGEIIDCEDFKAARAPLPAEQHPADYIDVGAAVTAMGNHLIDSKDPELANPGLGFSRTFIYGTFAGRMIFLEPMISQAYLAKRLSECTTIKTPAAWPTADYYPTSYCVRYDNKSATYRITLEGLVRRATAKKSE
ncbi:MAG: hypothetical protein AB1762_15260 [Gemmatimonadota bacterium]